MAGDYYETLGVSRSASEREIRTAFRRLARRHHPDVNPGDKDAEARFKEINEAHQVLSDPESRKKYDRYGANWKYADQAGAGAGPSPFTWFTRAQNRREPTGAGFGGIEDLFGNLFGGQTAPGGENLFGGTRYDVPTTISLEEAYTGTKRSVQLPPGASGAAGKRLEVSIPAGVESGSRVHVSVDGAASGGRRGARADVNVLVTVSPHPVFTRDGADLRLTADAPLVDAVLGGEIRAPLITGKSVALKIPPETQNGRVFRLTGKGMPRRSGSGHGDLLVTVRVVLPTGLTDDQRALFERLRESGKAKTA